MDKGARDLVIIGSGENKKILLKLYPESNQIDFRREFYNFNKSAETHSLREDQINPNYATFYLDEWNDRR